MQKVAVTGAMGFIGFHLCERLLNEGIEVIGMDARMGLQNEHIFHEKYMLIGRNANFTLYTEPMEQLPLYDLLKDVGVVFHLAATTIADAKWDNLQETIENNVYLTKKILRSCQEKTKFIFTSTVEVYGERTGIITERTPTNPTTPYGLTKLAGEALILREKEQCKLKVTIFRLPTIYGPWQREDMVFHQLLLAKILQKKANVGKDRSTLDILYVEDVVEALLLAGKANFEYEIFNLSSGKERQWYLATSYLLGKKDAGWSNELLKVTVSGDKAKKLLQFEPKVFFKDGLKKQEEHLRKYLHLYASRP